MISTATAVNVNRLRKASFGQGRNAEVLKLLVRLHDALVGEDELDRGRPPQPDPGLGDLVPVAGRHVPRAFQHDVVAAAAGALQDDAAFGIFDSLPSCNIAVESGYNKLGPDSQVEISYKAAMSKTKYGK